MRLPFKTLIHIKRSNSLPIYEQLANGLIKLIQEGKIIPGTFLPGTREMAELLSIHRKTIINAYEELLAQGWLESLPRKGYKVTPDLPVTKPRSFRPKNNFSELPATNEDFLHLPVLMRPGAVSKYKADAIIVDDGFPDTTLTPYDLFLQQYRQQLNNGSLHKLSLQKEEGGLLHLKLSTSIFLNQTRGLITVTFAVFMIFSLGIAAPFTYPVFVFTGAGLLLFTHHSFPWSIDAFLKNKRRQFLK